MLSQSCLSLYRLPFAFSLSFFLFEFPFLHYFSVEFFDGVRHSVRQLEEKDSFVVFDLIQKLPGYSVGNPVVSEVILSDRLVIFDNRNHFLFDLLLNRVANVLLVA
jgi:hypothetical protein